VHCLRQFTPDGTGRADHREQGSMIRNYIIWRGRRTLVDGANVA
jgi:hypothetical protein